MIDIKAISKEIHANNVEKGFWDKPRNKGEVLMLVVSELSEALEADRENRYYNSETRLKLNKDTSLNGSGWAFDIVDSDNEAWVNWFRSEIKDTFQDEIADAAIRIFDIAEGFGFDLEQHILAKLRYNKSRLKMHGKKY